MRTVVASENNVSTLVGVYTGALSFTGKTAASVFATRILGNHHSGTPMTKN